MARTGNPKLYLTLLGGGAFGNRETWISQAIQRALQRYRHWPLEVAIVSYRHSQPIVCELIDHFNTQA